mmetsp:Transcript_91764/g.256437  ORF Transcript_91764/g.256437 Transcript_91764/m.256437 type:complete len:215 (+) Transcript_91764:2298-2942(+)
MPASVDKVAIEEVLIGRRRLAILEEQPQHVLQLAMGVADDVQLGPVGDGDLLDVPNRLRIPEAPSQLEDPSDRGRGEHLLRVPLAEGAGQPHELGVRPTPHRRVVSEDIRHRFDKVRRASGLEQRVVSTAAGEILQLRGGGGHSAVVRPRHVAHNLVIDAVLLEGLHASAAGGIAHGAARSRREPLELAAAEKHLEETFHQGRSSGAARSCKTV